MKNQFLTLPLNCSVCTAMIAVSCLVSQASAQVIVNDPNFENIGGTTVASTTGNLYLVDTANFGVWQYNDSYWSYNTTTDAFDFGSNSDFRGWPVTQLIDTGSTNTIGNYTLDFTYSANNVSDIGSRTASLIYKVIGINGPGSLTDDSFNARISTTGTITDAVNGAMEGSEISPAGTEILEGFVDLSSASNVVNASESIAFVVASDFDSILISFSGWGFDTDNVGESLSLHSATVVVPEPSTYALLGGLACLGVVLMRRRRN